MSITGHDHRERIVEEAAAWFAVLQDGDATAEQRVSFAQWLSASSEHVREYLALTVLRGDLQEYDAARDRSNAVAELLVLARQPGSENVIPLSPSLTGEAVGIGTPRPAKRLRRVAAIAASLAIVIVASLWWRLDPDRATYVTERGEQKSFTLPDGSVVVLNAVSELELHFTAQYRDIRLQSGEALFEVARNPNRPFRVLTNDAIIQAVGTRFNVYHRQQDTTVSVVEGTVEIRSGDRERPLQETAKVRLSKGQRAHVDFTEADEQRPELSAPVSRAAPIVVTAADVDADTAWRERRLIFDAKPLGAAIAEFNLYNDKQFHLAAPELERLEISGTFNANDPQFFVLFLQQARIAAVRETTDGSIEILAR